MFWIFLLCSWAQPCTCSNYIYFFFISEPCSLQSPVFGNGTHYEIRRDPPFETPRWHTAEHIGDSHSSESPLTSSNSWFQVKRRLSVLARMKIPESISKNCGVLEKTQRFENDPELGNLVAIIKRKNQKMINKNAARRAKNQIKVFHRIMN